MCIKWPEQFCGPRPVWIFSFSCLCRWGVELGLNHCLVNSFRLPMMISVTLDNEVQAWIKALGRQRSAGAGGAGVVVLLLSGEGADHGLGHNAVLLCPNCHVRNICGINIAVVCALDGLVRKGWSQVCAQACSVVSDQPSSTSLCMLVRAFPRV